MVLRRLHHRVLFIPRTVVQGLGIFHRYGEPGLCWKDETCRILAVGTEEKESKKEKKKKESRFDNKINTSSKKAETKVKDNLKVFIWEPLTATKKAVKKVSHLYEKEIRETYSKNDVQ